MDAIVQVLIFIGQMVGAFALTLLVPFVLMWTFRRIALGTQTKNLDTIRKVR